jgi:hypothetical protein
VTARGDRPTAEPVSAWEAANRAAEAVRALNHVTLGPGGYAEPADVDAVLAELAALVWRLPQALTQAGRWLLTEHAAGRLGHDTYPAGLDPAVDQASSDLIQACRTAEILGAFLERAHEQTAHLGAVHDDPSQDRAPREGDR